MDEIPTRAAANVLIVSQPGPLRDSLCAFVQTLPAAGQVMLAEDAFSTEQVLAQNSPALVLIVDGGLDEDRVLQVLNQARAQGLKSRWVFLADTIQQEQRASAAGADLAFPQGFPAARLFSIVEELLSSQALPSSPLESGPGASSRAENGQITPRRNPCEYNG